MKSSEELPPMQDLRIDDLNRINLLPPDAMKLIEEKLPGDLCQRFAWWCKASKDSHVMCSNPDDKEWQKGCKLLGLDTKPVLTLGGGPQTWRKFFYTACKEITLLKKKKNSKEGFEGPYQWYLWYLEVRNAIDMLPKNRVSERQTVWLRRCAAEVHRRSITVLGEEGSKVLRWMALQCGTEEELNVALNKGREADTRLLNDGIPDEGYGSDYYRTYPSTVPRNYFATTRAEESNFRLSILNDGLYQGVNLNTISRPWQPPWQMELQIRPVLNFAARHNDIVLVDWLLSNGADPNYRVNTEFPTALMEACEWGNIKIIDMLLEKGADVRAVDDKNQQAYSYALRWLPHGVLRRRAVERSGSEPATIQEVEEALKKGHDYLA